MAAGLADRRQALESTTMLSSAKMKYKTRERNNYWLETLWYIG